MGLLALSGGFLANTAFAGNVEDCESLKQSGQKNLYGLCVAWHNADESAKGGLADVEEATAALASAFLVWYRRWLAGGEPAGAAQAA